MTIDNIKASLQKLHTTLESNGTVDNELKELLQKLDIDIQDLLKKDAADIAAKAPEPDLRSELVERAQGISARLAVKHPHLEPVLREIADTLTNMGI
ncbi:hypothetical protein CAter282_4521 [Collimonas arenae]|uniref:DUF4404 family protein n=1 Tax=Collimonas arenae TaxID=279058 RepID=A0A127PX01_9BURK|nr:DUF4404 family protein [Collimonas arenae]AMP02286.1 hypothetical protein CAter10_4921 [Collimonas arenae]AMP12181.1 hypothetical protein CAter282_4521 [Collimonas arenae]